MRGRKKVHVVGLTEDETERLRQVLASRNAAVGEAQRARIVLMCGQHPEGSDRVVAERVVAERVGCSDRMVRKWRKRWNATHSLKEAPRSGRPRVFSP